MPTRDQSGSLGRTLTVASLIAALCGVLGYGIGVGRWGGNLEAKAMEHGRRLDAADVRNWRQDQRDDRQDEHMHAIDVLAADTRESLAAIERDVAALLRATVAAP